MDIKEENGNVTVLFKEYKHISQLSENVNSRIEELCKYRAGYIKLYNFTVRDIRNSNAKVLTLLGNGIAICKVDIEKYPESLTDDKFYPFRFSSSSTPFSKLALSFTQLELEFGNQHMTISNENLISDKDEDILFTCWDGTPSLIRVKNGCIGFPII